MGKGNESKRPDLNSDSASVIVDISFAVKNLVSMFGWYLSLNYYS